MGGVFGEISDAVGDISKRVPDDIKHAPEILENAEKLGGFIKDVGGKVGIPGVAKAGERLAEQSGKLGQRVIKDDGVVKLVLKDGRQVKLAVTPILKYGQWLIKGMRYTTGMGDPETGDRFSAGAAKFTKIGELLQSSAPNNSWQGTGSDAYADQNAKQQQRAAKVISADRQMRDILAREAQQIMHTRDGLDDVSDWLAAASVACIALAAIPEVGEALQMAAEMAALETGLAIATPLTAKMLGDAQNNASQAQQVVNSYYDL